ncbi:MAG: helix-turn-helix domain-containing protein [Pyrinomonadaceae bacterium]
MAEDLPETIIEAGASGADEAGADYFEAVKQTKKQLILSALDNAQGNITEAAKLLGLYPTYLHRLMRNLDLKSARHKQSGGGDADAAKASAVGDDRGRSSGKFSLP